MAQAVSNSIPRRPFPNPVRLQPGLKVARKVLLDVHAQHGGLELALLALDITIESVLRIEHGGRA